MYTISAATDYPLPRTQFRHWFYDPSAPKVYAVAVYKCGYCTVIVEKLVLSLSCLLTTFYIFTLPTCYTYM